MYSPTCLHNLIGHVRDGTRKMPTVFVHVLHDKATADLVLLLEMGHLLQALTAFTFFLLLIQLGKLRRGDETNNVTDVVVLF